MARSDKDRIRPYLYNSSHVHGYHLSQVVDFVEFADKLITKIPSSTLYFLWTQLFPKTSPMERMIALLTKPAKEIRDTSMYP